MVKLKDTYATPQKVFDHFDIEFGFNVDVCAEDHTAKCPTYYTFEDDAFTKDWYKDGLMCWCNPPYSNITPWINKAIAESKEGVTTAMLVMADTSVGWFELAVRNCAEIRFIIGGRISFELGGIAQNGNNKGSILLIFRPRPENPYHTAHTSYITRKDILK